LGAWRMHNEKLFNLYTSPNIVRVIRSRMMKWMGHVVCMGGMRNAKFWLVNLDRRDHVEDLGVDGRVLLEWILGK